MINYTTLAEINQPIYRNIYLESAFDEFDDLSNDVETRAYAHELANLDFHVIDYIFSQENWHNTRFGDGTFPVWYGSADMITGFHETVYHWKRTFIESPIGFIDTDKNIITYRNLFIVDCRAALLDLRKDVVNHPELIDPISYHFTQHIGAKIFSLGQPGLITKSARYLTGDCVAVFNKKILFSPRHEDDYMYEYDIQHKTTSISKKSSNKVVCVIGTTISLSNNS